MKHQRRAKKFNKGKVRLSLNPEEAIEGMARAFMMGGDKYGDFNYEKGHLWLDLTDSLERHLMKFKKGIDYDEESGLPELWHILANAAMLEYNRVHHPKNDNRSKGKKNGKSKRNPQSKKASPKRKATKKSRSRK